MMLEIKELFVDCRSSPAVCLFTLYLAGSLFLPIASFANLGNQGDAFVRVLCNALPYGHWVWGLGDPDAGAIVVTGLYLLTSIVCLLVARHLHRKPVQIARFRISSSEATFWFVLALLLLFLGINKQADMQSLITLFGRDLFKYFGLYNVRRTVQVAFVSLVAFTALISVLFGLWSVRRWTWPSHIASIGLGIQAAFIVVRAASFQHFDHLIFLRFANGKINLIFESVGLVLMLFAAVCRWRMPIANESLSRTERLEDSQT